MAGEDSELSSRMTSARTAHFDDRLGEGGVERETPRTMTSARTAHFCLTADSTRSCSGGTTSASLTSICHDLQRCTVTDLRRREGHPVGVRRGESMNGMLVLSSEVLRRSQMMADVVSDGNRRAHGPDDQDLI